MSILIVYVLSLLYKDGQIESFVYISSFQLTSIYFQFLGKIQEIYN